MTKIKLLDKTKGVYQFYCPGCKEMHNIWTDKADGVDPWGFNGDVNNPTFTPSFKVLSYKGHDISGVCHSFIRNGKIEYLSDCTHELAGKTIDMVDIEQIL